MDQAKYGAGSRTRTDMVLPPRDFESRASANFAIPAYALNNYQIKLNTHKEYNKRLNWSIYCLHSSHDVGLRLENISF